MTNSKKGEHIIKEISKSNNCEKIDFEKATKGFLAMYQSVKTNEKRDNFLMI